MTVAQHTPSARQVLHSSESNEWYTPPEIIWAAQEMLGAIDLDPASSSEANQVVKARRFYTAADDGLSQHWDGRVFLNPPYGKVGKVSRQQIWSQRLMAEYVVGHVSAAVLLVNAATDTTWWQALARACPICLIDGRIKFREPEARRLARLAVVGKKQKDSPTHGNALVYLGPDIDHFGAVCMRLGTPAGKWPSWPGSGR